MKKFGLLSAVVLLLVLTCATLGFGQALTNYHLGGVFQANAFSDYTQSAGSTYGMGGLHLASAVSASGAATVTVDSCYLQTKGFGARKFTPIFVGNVLNVLDSTSETVTITTASVPANGQNCSFAATFSNTHPAGALLTSGSFGVAEAINAAKSAGGGMVRVGSDFGGTASTITALTVGASTVSVKWQGSSGEQYFMWNGATYTQSPGSTVGVTANGAAFVPFVNSELLTLSTGGTTTDTTANLLPANSIVLGVTGRVTTTISGGTCSGWQLGDPTTAGRFTASNSTLTAGTTDFGKVALTTGIASATTGMYQTAAAKVRVTCATGAPGAGVVRITVFGYTLTPPQS